MPSTLPLKTSLKIVAVLAIVVLATLIVIDAQQAQHAGQTRDAALLLSQASMLLPAVG